ncbi:MAG: hypothetical protein EOP41_09065 [Sphingobacteriaceae bacterium]|nr:MAG: hypothetical protein EOP41_09065 [Sphingobacteriaceae bacterium]
MHKQLPGMYAGIRSAAAHRFYRLAQQGLQGLFKNFLHTYRVLLFLPAVIIGAVKSQFCKIPLFTLHFCKGKKTVKATSAEIILKVFYLCDASFST